MTQIIARNNLNVLCDISLRKGWKVASRAPLTLRSPDSRASMTLTSGVPLFQWTTSHYAPPKPRFSAMTQGELLSLLESVERSSTPSWRA